MGLVVLLLKCGYNDEDLADGFEFAFFLLFYFLFFSNWNFRCYLLLTFHLAVRV